MQPPGAAAPFRCLVVPEPCQDCMHRVLYAAHGQGAEPEAPACAAGNVSIMGLFTVQVRFAGACALGSKAVQASARRIFGNLCANSLTMPTGCLPAVLSGGHLSGDGRRLDDGATGHSGWACVSCVAVFWAAWSS